MHMAYRISVPRLLEIKKKTLFLTNIVYYYLVCFIEYQDFFVSNETKNKSNQNF